MVLLCAVGGRGQVYSKGEMIRLLVLLLAAQAAGAQSFEAASVKVSRPDAARGSDGGPGSKDPLNFYFHWATLQDLIAIGYEVEYVQIVSKAPLDRDRYDIDAKLPPAASKADFRAMMRALLAERFRLKVHMESKEFPGFELVVAKGGSKLGKQPAQSMEGFPQMPPNRPGMSENLSMSGGYSLVRVRGQQQTTTDLASSLRRVAANEPKAFVVDRTGIDGKFDFTLEFARERPGAPDAPPEPATAPSLFTAVQQQLGLQLVSKKVVMPVVVVESVERVPTEN
jgi:uncharacterized protein (TIGR03435 family)